LLVTFVILLFIYVPEYYFVSKTLILLFFLTTMGEGAKKKRAAVARAAKKAKAAQLVEAPASDPAGTSSDVNIATQSNASNLKKTGTAPRVPSISSDKRSVPTRQSTRSLGSSASSSSSTLGSGKKHTSTNLEGNDNGKSRPQRSATVAALALLQELQVSETEDAEHDPEGVFTGNAEVDKNMELDEDEDEDGDSDSDEDDSDIVVIEEPPAVARKGLPNVSAVRKKPNLQAVDEDSESSSDSDEFGEYLY
jgi:hypothetical protein